jgi:WD40 repeat protein
MSSWEADQVYGLAAAGNGVLLATGSNEDHQTEVFTIDAHTGRRKTSRTLGPEIGASVAALPRRDDAAVAHNRTVDLCALDSLEPRLHIDLGDDKACCIDWSPDGKWITVGTVQRTLRIFEASTGREHLG